MSIDFLEEGSVSKPKRTKKGSSTPILDNFSRDLNKLAEEGKIDPVIGRDKEIKRIAQILSRKKKNNGPKCIEESSRIILQRVSC